MTERPVSILTVLPEAKESCLQLYFNREAAKNLDFIALLSGMRQNGAEKLGIAEIEGKQAVGFRRVDPFNDITIWADIKTGLPVKMEVVHSKPNQRIVCTDFDFETPLDDSLFSTESPEGYNVKKEIIGLKLDVREVTKEHVRQAATRPIYVLAKGLSWTKEPFIMEATDPSAKEEKMYTAMAVGADGRHVVLGQSVAFQALESQIHGGNKCLERNGFTVWNGGPEKWYSGIMLGSAEGMIPPGVSEDRTGYAIETPERTILVVGVNGVLADNELTELVENLELCTGAATENQPEVDSAAALLSCKEALETKIKEAEQSEDKESALLNLALMLSGKKLTPEEKAAALRMLKLNEKDLISGLANYVKLSSGVFPDSLDTKELIRKSGNLASAKNLTEKEMKSPAMEIVYAGAFYQKLLREKKEPHYTGGLKFTDASQSTELLRWKTEDGGFQVVYTDLSIKTVNP